MLSEYFRAFLHSLRGNIAGYMTERRRQKSRKETINIPKVPLRSDECNRLRSNDRLGFN